MQATDVSTVTAGVASTAVAALEHRQVDAAMLFGSSITTLQSRRPDFVMLIDTRSVEGLRKVFGVDNYPASCLLGCLRLMRCVVYPRGYWCPPA